MFYICCVGVSIDMGATWKQAIANHYIVLMCLFAVLFFTFNRILLHAVLSVWVNLGVIYRCLFGCWADLSAILETSLAYPENSIIMSAHCSVILDIRGTTIILSPPTIKI